MVWFQCEDCGDNLKKPKLAHHFNICSATKLSCIDCGEMFGQESVQRHTQCITETEKYGPKGVNKPSNGATPKQNKDTNQKPDFDITVGLTERPPWFCSLCNTKATSRQTLLLHAEGKKHKGKARAIHNANQPPKPVEEPASETKPSTENLTKEAKQDGGKEIKASDEKESNKKRKLDESDDATDGRGEVIQGSEKEKMEKIKWKKLITSALKSSPEGVLKMKKLKKTVLKAVEESGITGDLDKLTSTLESKIISSSRFSVENKYVSLVAKD